MNAQVSQNGLLGPVALATADGEVWVATGANAGEMVAILDSSNQLKPLYGGLGIDASGIATGGLLKGASAGVFGILARGAALQHLRVNSGGTDLEFAAPPGGDATTIEAFETAITGASTFNTGALSAEPKLIIVFGIAADSTAGSSDTMIFSGFATGTGSGAKGIGLNSDNPVGAGETSVSGDADAVGGIGTEAGGNQNTAFPQEDLDVTVFSKASGITLDWSGTAVSFSNIKLVVIEAE